MLTAVFSLLLVLLVDRVDGEGLRARVMQVQRRAVRTVFAEMCGVLRSVCAFRRWAFMEDWRMVRAGILMVKISTSISGGVLNCAAGGRMSGLAVIL